MTGISEEIAPAGGRKRWRGMLDRKLAELRIRLSKARAAEAVRRPEEPLDSGDWCQKSHEEWLFLNRNRLEVALLRDIEHALRRLDEGTYGLCQECRQPISRRRLEAVPWAALCLPCQERVRPDGVQLIKSEDATG